VTRGKRQLLQALPTGARIIVHRCTSVYITSGHAEAERELTMGDEIAARLLTTMIAGELRFSNCALRGQENAKDTAEGVSNGGNVNA
jgi:hypothetical protein